MNNTQLRNISIDFDPNDKKLIEFALEELEADLKIESSDKPLNKFYKFIESKIGIDYINYAPIGKNEYRIAVAKDLNYLIFKTFIEKGLASYNMVKGVDFRKFTVDKMIRINEFVKKITPNLKDETEKIEEFNRITDQIVHCFNLEQIDFLKEPVQNSLLMSAYFEKINFNKHKVENCSFWMIL